MEFSLIFYLSPQKHLETQLKTVGVLGLESGDIEIWQDQSGSNE